MFKQGFTLIEILIVVTLIGILTTSLFVNFDVLSRQSLEYKQRNAFTTFVNQSLNYINFENWKTSVDTVLYFKINDAGLKLLKVVGEEGEGGGGGEEEEGIKGLEDGELDLINLTPVDISIKFSSNNSCEITNNNPAGGDNPVESISIPFENVNAKTIFQLKSDNKNCYIELLKP